MSSLRIAYFDCPFGAAGDMLLGAMLSAGLDVLEWRNELQKISLPEGSFEIRVDDVLRTSVAAKKVEVLIANEPEHSKVHAQVHPHSHRHSHRHHHAHEHSHDHEHEHPHDHAHEHTHVHRGLTDVLTIIESSTITDNAKRLASRIFTRLGRAEAKVHGTTPDQVHFHEVGAIDAIVDIVGFAIAYDLMGIDKAVVSPMPLGAGTVRSMHGLFPVPGPAVLELMAESGAPVRATNLSYECLTPTGCAILTTIADSFGPVPELSRVASVGYGAGSLDPADHPNVVRVLIGESVSTAGAFGSERINRFRADVVSVIEANLDDCTPQIIAHAQELLMREGALDVAVLPCVMKKGRSAHLLSVIALPGDSDRLKEIVMNETTTIGVRCYTSERLIAERDWQEVTVGKSKVRIKVARDLDGQIVHVQPEYEDCVNCAAANGMPLKTVLSIAQSEAEKLKTEKQRS